MRFAVRGGRLCEGGALVARELLVEDGVVAAVAPAVDPSAPTIDGTGLVVLPGAIDAHVHFREPGDTHKEDWESGSHAALAGGVTTVLDMPNTRPPTTTRAALEVKRALAARRSAVDFGLYFGVTDDNLEEVRASLRAGVVALKVYLAPSTGGLVAEKDEILAEVFAAAAAAETPVSVHAEDACGIAAHRAALGRLAQCADHGALRDLEGAVRSVARALALADRAGAHVHIAHLSSDAEARLVLDARARGQRVTCEVAPHHLLLDEGFVRAHGCLGKVNPPLRPEGEPARLFEHVRSGVVDLVATDHAPHLLSEKGGDYDAAAAGLPSVELFYPLLLSEVAAGRLSLARVLELAAEGPARVFGLSGKGRLAAGYDADFVLVDLAAVRVVDATVIRTRAGWSPYAGRALTGWPRATFVRGEPAERARGREVRLQRGAGRAR